MVPGDTEMFVVGSGGGGRMAGESCAYGQRVLEESGVHAGGDFMWYLQDLCLVLMGSGRKGVP